jgi:hypothetical protein
MFSQNQVQTLMIGKSSTALSVVATDGAKPAGLIAGEIGAFTKGGARYVESGATTNEADALAGKEFILYKKMADGTLLRSEVLSTANVEKVILKIGVAATEKVEHFGYTGSTGSIEALDENFYRLRINLKEGYSTNNHGTEMVKHAIYESDASATQAEVAIGLAGSGISNFSREPKNSLGNPAIKFKALCNVALASDFAFDNSGFDMTVTKGSKIILSGAATPTYNTGTALSVGDFLRIGTAAGVVGTVALESDVYKVVSFPTSTTIEVDRPLQVNSGVYVDNSGNITVIPAALGVAADWGVALTGQEQDFIVGKKAYVKADWVSTKENFGNTTYTATTAMSPGTAVYEQISEMEWFLQGNEGNFMRMGYPMIDPARAEVQDTQYDTVEIIFRDTLDNAISRTSNRKVLSLAIPQSTPAFYTSAADDLAGVISTLLVGVPVYNATKNGSAMAVADLDL